MELPELEIGAIAFPFELEEFTGLFLFAGAPNNDPRKSIFYIWVAQKKQRYIFHHVGQYGKLEILRSVLGLNQRLMCYTSYTATAHRSTY